jgi:hypothetical protein
MKYYKPTGFTLDGIIEGSGLLVRTAAAVTIAKGDALHDDGNGYATNATTAFSNAFLGIAAHACTSGGSISIIPPNPEYKFWVCNGVAGTQLAQTDVGETCDLEEVNTIDCTDNTVAGWGFVIEAIDISTAALAADGELAAAGGFAKGHFEKQPQ